MTRRAGAIVGAGAVAVVIVAVLATLLVTAGSQNARERSRAPGTSVQLVPWSWSSELSFYQPPSPLPEAPPGTLVRVQHLAPDTRLPSGTVAWRILYHSRSQSGSDVIVSGVVVAPSGPAPTGGFPVVDYAHATTGLAAACAPSRFSTLEIPSLATFIRTGDAVVATDYDGLGTPGPSSYVVGTSEGYAVLDADRAARQIPGLRISRRVVVLGYSQGGQAALFAGQLASSYAPTTDLLGVVAEAPAVELPQLVDHLMSRATFNGLVVTLAVSWSEVYPDLPLASLLSPVATALDTVTASGCELQIDSAYRTLSPTEVFSPAAFPTRAGTNPEWQDLLVANSPGARPLTAPTLVVTGSADTVLPHSLVSGFVDRACSVLDDPITYDTFSGANHGTITQAAASTVDGFVAARLAGVRWTHPCTRRVVKTS